MSADLQQIKDYISSADLSDLPRPIIEQDAASEAGEVFEKTKQQAQVVGAGILSFADGVDEETRKVVSASTLFAQLVTKKRSVAEDDPLSSFRVYFEVLQNIGWTVQDQQWNDYTASGNAGEVHEKILEVMTAALGPAPATLLILAATVKALKSMNPGSSWLQIFNRETQKARYPHFQVGVVEVTPDGKDVVLSLLACLVEADQTITQVLFFKYRQAHASFKAAASKATTDRASIASLHDEIRRKTREFQHSYVSSIRDL
jgi:hypothetical protein